MSNHKEHKEHKETEQSEVSTSDLLAENRVAAERIVWIAHQPKKIAEICEHWFEWQWNELTDEELIEKIGEIIFRDYPKRVVQIPANKEAYLGNEHGNGIIRFPELTGKVL